MSTGRQHDVERRPSSAERSSTAPGCSPRECAPLGTWPRHAGPRRHARSWRWPGRDVRWRRAREPDGRPRCRNLPRRPSTSFTSLPTAARRTSTRSTPSRRWRSMPDSCCRRRTCAPNARPARRSLRRSNSRSTDKAASRSASCSPTCRHIDDMCVIRSMHADVPNHEPSLHADELRRRAVAAPQLRLVDHLWPGDREPEPAGLHRHVPGRLSDQGRRRTGSRPSCPAPTRARTSTRSTPSSTS